MSNSPTSKQEFYEWAQENVEKYERHKIFDLDYDGPSPINEDVRLEGWTSLKKDDLRHMEVFEKLPNSLNKLFLWAMNKTTNIYELAKVYKKLSDIDFQTLKNAHTVLKVYRYRYNDYEYLAESNPNMRLFLELLRHIANNQDRMYVRQVHTIRQQIVMRAYEGYPECFGESQEFRRLVEVETDVLSS